MMPIEFTDEEIQLVLLDDMPEDIFAYFVQGPLVIEVGRWGMRQLPFEDGAVIRGMAGPQAS